MANLIEALDAPVAILGEGPCWHAGTLYWVDIAGRKVHATTESGTRTLETPSMVGFVAPRAAGGLIVGLEDGIYALSQGGKLDRIAPVEPEVAASRMNDGSVDPSGRLWAGTMHRDGSEAIGSLYMLDREHTLTTKISPVGISNGLGWSPARDTMYYIDTPLMEVRAFPYDDETGALGPPETLVRFDPAEGCPDGMDVDAEGNIWVALWDGWGVQRISPKGARLEKIDVPAQRVTACAFGGDGLDELYITTATEGLGPAALEAQPGAGGLYRARPGVRGIPAREYRG